MACVLDCAQHNALGRNRLGGGGAALLPNSLFVLGSTFQKQTTIQSILTIHPAQYLKYLPRVCLLIHLAEAVSVCLARKTQKRSLLMKLPLK